MNTLKSNTPASRRKTAVRSMTPLMDSVEFQLSNDSIRFPKMAKGKFDSEKRLIEKITKISGVKATLITDYLLLSARTPYVSDKGFINVINGQSFWPEDPHIDFPWWSPEYPSLPTAGKIEIWLSGLTEQQSLTVELRVSGYSYNNNALYEVRSSLAPGLYGYFPIKLNQKIDLFFTDIELTATKGLITIEPIDIHGSWIFYDVKINIVD